MLAGTQTAPLCGVPQSAAGSKSNCNFLVLVYLLNWTPVLTVVFFLSRIKRAFLIEEQKIVVKVLKAQAQSQKSK
uniref:Large ribosomal subunit protein eL34 n=1 Tax=Anas zonorhyncha TaxID=75864 RepID=A0A8B9UEL3_9AVES